MPALHALMTASAPSSALAQPGFRRYFAAACLSNMATWISRFLIGWAAWELTHAALWVGIVSALMLLPTFVLSPLFGVVSDRVNPRNALLVTLGSLCLLVASLALLPAGWIGGLWSATAMITVLALAATMVGTGCQALVQLACEDDYRSRILSLWTVVAMGSPAIGSLLVGAAADHIGLAPTLVASALLGLLLTTALTRALQRGG
ncbi:MAG: MFS transporter [Parahaliea sp.]